MREKMLILFGDNAPAELKEMSICHPAKPMLQDVKVGDEFILGNQTYRVTAVGDEANETLKTMGHCTLSFYGKDEVQLPGHIELQGEAMPDPEIGMIFKIIHK